MREILWIGHLSHKYKKSFRGIDTFSGATTVKRYLPPFCKGVYFKRKDFAPLLGDLFRRVLVDAKANRKTHYEIKDKRKVQGMPQTQTAALPRHQEKEETKQAQIEQTYEKH